MSRLRLSPLFAGLWLFACTAAPPPQANRPRAESATQVSRFPPIRFEVSGLERREGLFTTYLDTARGRLLLELPPAAADGVLASFLYAEGITSGLGSSAIGLDRGETSEAKLVRLRRLGGKVLAEAPNLRFRAAGGDPAARRAVGESFAPEVLWGGDVLAEDPDGHLLVDFTGFVVRDAHETARVLTAVGGGTWQLDPQRSALDAVDCDSFPENLELEALLTFAVTRSPGEDTSGLGNGESLSFRQHHTLLRLPDAGYVPRIADPRSGSISISFRDVDAAPAESGERHWVVRHRLEKTDPAAERSPVRRPIVYYVDRAIPEPARSAVLEGARWWARAFEAAGFVDAFRVELLPEGVSPLDARFQVIEWVHRDARGWSYGSGIVDPRTGERVAGHIQLDAMRLRYDRLLFEGLLGSELLGTGGAADPVEISLARLRQLAAHEVGHALGLAHNFAASTYGRASVMDYPGPYVRVTEGGAFDMSRAYSDGLGDWDLFAIAYSYRQFAPGADEAAELDRMMRDALARDLIFLSDEDARPTSAGNPRASLWDNGADPVTELERTLTIRRLALARFGERNLPLGLPFAELEDRLTPLYFFHRHQIIAASKILGGLDYRHAVRGDGQGRARRLRADEQRRALTAVLAALAPEELDLPEAVLQRLTPPPPGWASGPDLLDGGTGPSFDALGAAAALADATLATLLDPARAARLVDFHRRNQDLPGLDELLEKTISSVFVDAALLEPRLAELARTTQRVLVERLFTLAADERASAAVRARAEAALASLLQRLDKIEPLDTDEKAHLALLTADIGRFLSRPATAATRLPAAPVAPRGDPLGDSCSLVRE